MKPRSRYKEAVLCLAAGLLGLSPISAYAKGDTYAYIVARSMDFGVIDLNTGVFTRCGNTGVLQAGLGLGPNGAIYGAAYMGSTISTINPSNGALTAIGSTGFPVWAFGSASGGRLYALDAPGNLYSINPATGVAALVGSTGLTFNDSESFGVSTGAANLYISINNQFYEVNRRTAKAKLLGSETTQFGGFVWTKHTLYGGSLVSPYSVYTVNTSNGSDTLVAAMQGEATDFWGLAPTPKGAKGTCPA